MIARIWRGRTRESDQNSYFEYLQATGLKDYASIPSNRGVWVLRRVYEGKAEFTLISLWDSWDAIKAFAGPEYEKAVYYPKDKKFCWNSIRTSRTTRFCSPAEARRIGGDNLPPATSAFPRWKPTSGSPWFPPTWLAHRDAPVPLSCLARAHRFRRSESQWNLSSRTRTTRRWQS